MPRGAESVNFQASARGGQTRQTCGRVARGAMARSVWEALARLDLVDPEAKAKCLETVRLLLTNVIEHPTEAKFRRIRLANSRFVHAR